MSKVRILNSDKEVTAVKFNMKEQRCLQKNLVTLDAEASYSVKLIDMENRGLKVFYRRFRDKVSKIRSHLKVNEISRLKDLEASGRLSPPHNTANTTAMLKIADAEKRLKLQGREHLRKTKSAFTRRSLSTDRGCRKQSILSGSFESHLDESGEKGTFQKRPTTIAWDSKLNVSHESISRRQSKEIESIKTKQDDMVHPKQVVDKINIGINIPSNTEIQSQMIIPEIKVNAPKCTGISIVYGEDLNTVLTNSNQNKLVNRDKIISDTHTLRMSNNFIETGNLNSPRILNKTTQDMSDNKEENKDIESEKEASTSNKKLIGNKTVTGDCTVNSGRLENTKDVDQSHHQQNNVTEFLDIPKSVPSKQKKCGNNVNYHKKTEQTYRHEPANIDSNQGENQGSTGSNNKTASESQRLNQNYNRLAVPRTSETKSIRCKSEKCHTSRSKSTNSSPERRSKSTNSNPERRSISTGKPANFAHMVKQYSCHNVDKESIRMMESRASFSIQDGLFCIGDDPYEERRQLMIMDEHNRFVILLHKKEEYLQRIEEYIRIQMLASATFDESGEVKINKSPKDIWDELKNCRYLRREGAEEEEIDLSTVVTLASEQLKVKSKLTYKPLFQKQKSKKAIIVEANETVPLTISEIVM